VGGEVGGRQGANYQEGSVWMIASSSSAAVAAMKDAILSLPESSAAESNAQGALQMRPHGRVLRCHRG